MVCALIWPSLQKNYNKTQAISVGYVTDRVPFRNKSRLLIGKQRNILKRGLKNGRRWKKKGHRLPKEKWLKNRLIRRLWNASSAQVRVKYIVSWFVASKDVENVISKGSLSTLRGSNIVCRQNLINKPLIVQFAFKKSDLDSKHLS